LAGKRRTDAKEVIRNPKIVIGIRNRVDLSRTRVST